MEASNDAPIPPTREQVRAMLEDLVSGKCSRETAANWAQPWIIMDDPPDMDEDIWDALGNLATADMKTIDRPYLYDQLDFVAWLEELYQ